MSKVVILGSAYPLRGGGLATFNERMAREFMDQGHEVTIYTFSLQYPGILFPGKTQYSDEDPPGDLDIRVKVNSINPLNWIRVGRELKKLRPDLLVIRYWLPFMAPCLGSIAGITRKNKHTRVVAITDNILPHEKRPGDTLLTRYFLKKIHGFVSMTDAVASDLMKFGIDQSRVAICPHPLYDNFGKGVTREAARKELGIDDAQNLVLFFGFIRDYKGLDLLLEAFAREEVRGLPVKLLVAGEFYTRPEPYHELAGSLKIDDRVIWHTHFIPNNQVKNYFCAADLVAQPYKSATQSGVTQIAYHFEKPMLVTNVGGLPEMVSDGKAGYVVEPEPKAIARSIAQFVNKNEAKALSHTLKEEKQRFSWERLVKALFEVSVK